MERSSTSFTSLRESHLRSDFRRPPQGNGDPSIVVYPQPLTPNLHALANNFVDLDNFYDSGEVSGDGWNWSTSARAADTIEKTEPINYAGRGLNYDYEGTNRNVNVGLATPQERAAAFPAYNSLPQACRKISCWARRTFLLQIARKGKRVPGICGIPRCVRD